MRVFICADLLSYQAIRYYAEKKDAQDSSRVLYIKRYSKHYHVISSICRFYYYNYNTIGYICAMARVFCVCVTLNQKITAGEDG